MHLSHKDDRYTTSFQQMLTNYHKHTPARQNSQQIVTVKTDLEPALFQLRKRTLKMDSD